MAVFKYLNPNYVEGGSEPKWIKIPLTGSAVITPVQSTGQSEVDIMSQKAVTDALNTKQNTLVSGTNIKTINGQSLVGTGNITTVGRSNGVGETFNSSTNVATGANSHAEGANTNASGNNSHTEGSFTQAKNSYEHAEGHYNLSHQDGTHAGTTRHSVGMGNSDEDRKNAFEIMADGSAYMMDLGGYDGINYASATSVQDVIKGKQDALVSGNTIKTINGQSLLGSGNITIESDATFNNGHNAVSSVAGIPVSKRLVIATISNNGSFTLASTPADGREIHVIVHNTNSSDIEITMPSGSNYVKMSGDTLTVAGNSYADINVISDGTNMYIRAL